jgi:hypothetical protein
MARTARQIAATKMVPRSVMAIDVSAKCIVLPIATDFNASHDAQRGPEVVGVYRDYRTSNFRVHMPLGSRLGCHIHGLIINSAVASAF